MTIVFSKPERVPCPHSDEARTIFPKRMQDHVVDAVQLHGTMTSSHARVRGANKYARIAGSGGA